MINPWKCTPGPWVVDGVYIVSESTGARVADLSPWQGPGKPLLPLDKVQANGQILVAARDIFDALYMHISLIGEDIGSERKLEIVADFFNALEKKMGEI